MSALYTALKYNVDKINSIYKKGVTFHKSKVWIPPVDGKISIEGLGRGNKARDYIQGHVGYASSYNMIFAYGANVFEDLYKTFGAQYAGVRTGEVNVKKSSSYPIFIDNDVKFNDVSYGCLSADCSYLNITPGRNEYGFYPISVGQVFHIESRDKTNPSFMGDCDLTITDCRESWDYSRPIAAKIETYTYNISKIYRQPSEAAGTIAAPYIKIKYSNNVLDIFNDLYA